MSEFYPFFLIIFAGVFFSMLSRRVHIPWVIALIFGGILLGPHAFNILTSSPTIEFVGQIGLIFLMFMAGLETKLSSFRGFHGGLAWLSFINGAIPFAVGLGIGYFLGYGWLSSLLIGIIFVSSSIAVVIPSLESQRLLHTRLGQSVVMTSVIQDVASLIMLSLVLQSVSPVTSLPLYIFYPLLFLALIIFRKVLPKIRKFFTESAQSTQDFFQQEFRGTFLVLIGTVIAFEFLGLHPIIAGFFSGLVLADSISSEKLKEKIRTISYGIFIPTFFIIIGLQTDISVFWTAEGAVALITLIVSGSVISKFFSGWIGGKMVGFTRDQALIFGISSVPQLSTTLAVAFTALSLGLIDQKLITAMVVLSIVTVLVSPTLMSLLGDRMRIAAAKHEIKV